ncbi:MAG TPA: peptidylprolyl isomerase [Caulobacteraceae bacterium]|nr:peptidylprolyl isomerase [Caulobacteraceae bacterium]
MGKAASFAATIMAMAALAGSGRAQDAPPSTLRQGVVAIVNDNVISSYDLQQRVLLLIATSGVQPTAQNTSQFEQEAVNELIDESLEMQEVRRAEKDQKFKIVADDNAVKERVDEIASQSPYKTGDRLLEAFSNAGIAPETFRNQVRADISWQDWMHGRYGGSRLKISPAQIKAVVDEIEAQAAQPQYLLGEILVDADHAGGMDKAEAAGEQLVAQIQQGAQFAQIARQFSSSSTAATGGDTGWLSAAELPAELRPVVEQLRQGEISKPIPSQSGVYIMLMRDKRAGSTSQLVSLKQAAISLAPDATPQAVADAQRKLTALKGQLSDGCDGLEAKAGKVAGVVAGDLGEADVKDLKPEFRDAIQSLPVGQVAGPIRTGAGLHLIAVCNRRQAGVSIPPSDQIEARLKEQEIGLISKRQLRDLRNSATIEFP